MVSPSETETAIERTIQGVVFPDKWAATARYAVSSDGNGVELSTIDKSIADFTEVMGNMEPPVQVIRDDISVLTKIGERFSGLATLVVTAFIEGQPSKPAEGLDMPFVNHNYTLYEFPSVS